MLRTDPGDFNEDKEGMPSEFAEHAFFVFVSEER